MFFDIKTDHGTSAADFVEL